MADFTQIIQEINDNVNTNGANEITGAKLNQVLRDMIAAVNAAKQDPLTIDATPTEDSTNPVQSGGVYEALGNLYQALSVAENCLFGGIVTRYESPIQGDDHRYYYITQQVGYFHHFDVTIANDEPAAVMIYWSEAVSKWVTVGLWPKLAFVESKADKVGGATSGNLAGLDSDGNLTDSGIAASDVATTSDLAGKQDTISDLATIRSGAASGATAYQKPSSGIPQSDLSSDVQSQLNKHFKGWFASVGYLETEYPSPVIGDYAYVKGAETTDPAAIYECTTAGTWSDSGRTADTSNVQTFASGEEVNEISIDNNFVGGSDKIAGADEVKQLEDKVTDFYLPINTDKSINLGGVLGVTITLTPQSEDGWSCAVVPCVSGDSFTITGKGGGTTRLWGFVDSENKLIAVSTSLLVGTNLKVVAPENSAYFVSNSSTELSVSCSKYGSLPDVNARLSELTQKVDTLDLYAYFSSGDRPRFTISGTTINVALPTNTLTIYYRNGGTCFSLSSFASQNWDVPVSQRLVYDIDNNTMSVKGPSVTGNFVVLFENSNTGFDGLLASYFTFSYATDYADSNVVGIGVMAYFASLDKPTFKRLVGGVVSVTFPANEMRLYKRTGGSSLITTTAFANQTYNVGQLQKLVYDIDSQTVSVVGYTATATNQVVLFANRDGMALGGAFLPYYSDWLARNDTFVANGEAEIINLLQQANFPGKIGSTDQAKQLVFAHFSDIHFSKNELDRITNFVGRVGNKLTDVICTGDLVSTAYNNTSSADYTAFWADATKFLVAIGNHDTAKESDGSYDWDYYAGKDAYDRYIAPYVSQWGVTQPANASTNGYCYYYKDYAQQGIRLIVLDAMKYDTTQDDWFKGVLSSAQTSGLAVIVAEHFPPADIIHTNNVFDASAPDFWRGSEMNILNPLAAQTVDGFMNGTLAGMSDNGEFICWLAGHTHKDTFAKLEDYPNQYCILITCATASSSYGDQDRVRGTKSQDAFNIVAVDTYSKTLRLFRIGADYDRFFRHRYTLCWNYETHELVYES